MCSQRVVGEQPDIDAEFASSRSMLRCVTRAWQIKCCSIGFNSRIDDRAAVEGADRQRDRERLDQKAACRWCGRLETMVKPMPASCSRRTAALAPRRSGPCPWSPACRRHRKQRGMRYRGHERHTAGFNWLDDRRRRRWSLDRRVDRHGDRTFVRLRRLQRLELAGEQARRHESGLCARRAGQRSDRCVPSRKTMRTSLRPCTRMSR